MNPAPQDAQTTTRDKTILASLTNAVRFSSMQPSRLADCRFTPQTKAAKPTHSCIVVGAGFAGLTAAYRLSAPRAGTSPCSKPATVLEAVSGRTTLHRLRSWFARWAASGSAKVTSKFVRWRRSSTSRSSPTPTGSGSCSTDSCTLQGTGVSRPNRTPPGSASWTSTSTTPIRISAVSTSTTGGHGWARSA